MEFIWVSEISLVSIPADSPFIIVIVGDLRLCYLQASVFAVCCKGTVEKKEGEGHVWTRRRRERERRRRFSLSS
jgi:hypothetical protein